MWNCGIFIETGINFRRGIETGNAKLISIGFGFGTNETSFYQYGKKSTKLKIADSDGAVPQALSKLLTKMAISNPDPQFHDIPDFYSLFVFI